MLTTGEIITNTGRFHINVGSDAILSDSKLRDRLRFFLVTLAKDIWDLAPFWFRLKSDGQVSVVANDSSVAMPSDFSHTAAEMSITLQNFPLYKLTEIAPDILLGYRRQVGTSTLAGRPLVFTLQGRSALGRPMLQFWPNANAAYTFLVDNYVKLMPDLVDRPTAPAVAVGSATGLTGVYQWLVTFVTASGETEAGVASTALTLANQKGSLSAIPVSPCRSVTSRKVYRTVAGGTVFKLAATIADNTTTTLIDALADGSLGANAPTVSDAVTGMEQFPEDTHERLFVKGLRNYNATAQGDLRDNKWYDDWRKDVQRFWGEYQQGQTEPLVMPAYGSFSGNTSAYPRWY